MSLKMTTLAWVRSRLVTKGFLVMGITLKTGPTGPVLLFRQTTSTV